MLPGSCILTVFSGQFRGIFAVFAGRACKNSKNKHRVSAVGAKGTEKWKALEARTHRIVGSAIFLLCL